MINTCIKPVQDVAVFKAKVLNWLKRFSTFAFLDNNDYSDHWHRAEMLVGAGIQDGYSIESASMAHMQVFLNTHAGKWIMGHISYDLKNEMEGLVSHLPDEVGFPIIGFFVPQVVIKLKGGTASIICNYAELVWSQINEQHVSTEEIPFAKIKKIDSAIDKATYIEKIEQIKEHIHRGDCYELNFCMPFYARNVHINPIEVYRELNNISPHPFSVLYRHNNKWLISASPERFLTKKGNLLTSQPMKGTLRRSVQPMAESIKALQNDNKEQAENVMVVDMVRNDLSRICKPGTVCVKELYGVYTFPQVYQMVSTIEGELEAGITFENILQATFPMGSMTGAPKRRVMELIEEYEVVKRGLFSGSVGYIDPTSDFDFNVIIRSILYNEQHGYLQYEVGSGITSYSIPHKEWDECLLKAQALRKVLGGSD